MLVGERKARAIGNAAEKRKKRYLAAKVAPIPGEVVPGRSRLVFNYVAVAFEFLGSPSEKSHKVMEKFAAVVASRSDVLLGK